MSIAHWLSMLISHLYHWQIIHCERIVLLSSGSDMVGKVHTVELLSLKTPPAFENSLQCAVWHLLGREKNWHGEENALLARALLAASEDTIWRTNMTTEDIKEAVWRRFVELIPINATNTDKLYPSRSELSISRQVTDLSPDLHKFRFSVKNIKEAGPTQMRETRWLFFCGSAV